LRKADAIPSSAIANLARQLRRMDMSSFGATMQVSANLRARISALGELSRPLGETRAAALAHALANAVARDVAAGRSPDETIDGWIRRLATEVAAKTPAPAGSAAPKAARPRRLSDVLPEVH
jgi:hypothetical protein